MSQESSINKEEAIRGIIVSSSNVYYATEITAVVAEQYLANARIWHSGKAHVMLHSKEVIDNVDLDMCFFGKNRDEDVYDYGIRFNSDRLMHEWVTEVENRYYDTMEALYKEV